MKLEERLELLHRADHHFQLATQQENADGDAREAIDHYVTGMELVILAVHEFPFATKQSRDFVLSQYKSKLNVYRERVRLLTAVAADEEKMKCADDAANETQSPESVQQRQPSGSSSFDKLYSQFLSKTDDATQ